MVQYLWNVYGRKQGKRGDSGRNKRGEKSRDKKIKEAGTQGLVRTIV